MVLNKKGLKMNKYFLTFSVLLFSFVKQAYGFDFSAIDPRLSSDRPSSTSSTEADSPKAEPSVLRSPQKMVEDAERPKAPSRMPLTHNSVKIVAVVNGEPISTEDLDSRVKAFIMASQVTLNDDNKAVIYQKVLTSAIDEKLKYQDALKNNINISDKELNAAVAGFENANKIPSGKLGSVLKQYGINEQSFREQMRSDLAWMRLIRQKVKAEGGVSQKEVDEELARAKKDFSTPKYQISEIFISQANASKLPQLEDILKTDSRFEYYAFQFSESPTASSGGRLGWINKESLADPLQQAVEKMSVGEVSSPIKVGNDYYIIKLEQVYKPDANTHMPTEKDIRLFLENQRIDAFANKYIQQLRQKAVIEFRG